MPGPGADEHRLGVGSARPASVIIAAARPDSPTRRSTSVACWAGTIAASATATATKTSHSPIARHGWVALHRATRTVPDAVRWVRHCSAFAAERRGQGCRHPTRGGPGPPVLTRGGRRPWRGDDDDDRPHGPRPDCRGAQPAAAWTGYAALGIFALGLGLFVLTVVGTPLVLVTAGVLLRWSLPSGCPGQRLPRSGRPDAGRRRRRRTGCPTAARSSAWELGGRPGAVARPAPGCCGRCPWAWCCRCRRVAAAGRGRSPFFWWFGRRPVIGRRSLVDRSLLATAAPSTSSGGSRR